MSDRELSVDGPRVWNALPADIRCLDTFKKRMRLQSHLFSAAYEQLGLFYL